MLLNFLKGLLFKIKKNPKQIMPLASKNECNFCPKEIAPEKITFMTKKGANFVVKTCPECVKRAKDSLCFIEAKGQ